MCDDSEWFSDLVAAYIQPHADLQFVGSADERHVAFERLTAARPDVVLVDTMTYGLEPIRADEVRAAAPNARELICSGYPEQVASAVVGVADGFIRKGGGEAESVAAIRALVG